MACIQLVQTEKTDGDTSEDKVETLTYSMIHAEAFQFFEKALQCVQEGDMIYSIEEMVFTFISSYANN